MAQNLLYLAIIKLTKMGLLGYTKEILLLLLVGFARKILKAISSSFLKRKG